MSKHFEMEREMRDWAHKYGFQVTFVHTSTAPKMMSEPSELVSNPSMVILMVHQGSVTHKLKMVLHNLPCSELYKKYLIQKYHLGPV